MWVLAFTLFVSPAEAIVIDCSGEGRLVSWPTNPDPIPSIWTPVLVSCWVYLTKQWRPDNFGTITEVADRFESNRRLLFWAFSLLTSKTEAPVSSSIIVLH